MTDAPTEVLDAYPLDLIQGQTYYRRFAWRLTGTSADDVDATYGNFHDVNVRSQVRTKEDKTSDLILDLTQYLTVVDDTGSDGKFLDLRIPGEATMALDSFSALRKATAAWDIFAADKNDVTNDSRLFQGPVSMDYAATDATTIEEAP